MVALDAGKLDLVDEVGPVDRVGHVLVIVRALGIQLVFEVNACDAGTNEFPHRAHHMQRLAEARSRIRYARDVNGRCDLT